MSYVGGFQPALQAGIATMQSLQAAFANGGVQVLTDIISVKASDTLTGPTTRTAFGTNCLIAANTISVGQSLEITGQGSYNLSTGIGPTTIADLAIGTTVLIATPALSLPLSVSNTYGYTFQAYISIISATQAIATGVMQFQTATDGTGGVVLPISGSTVAWDNTVDKYITSNVLCSTAASTFKQKRFTVKLTNKPAAAS